MLVAVFSDNVSHVSRCLRSRRSAMDDRDSAWRDVYLRDGLSHVASGTDPGATSGYTAREEIRNYGRSFRHRCVDPSGNDDKLDLADKLRVPPPIGH